MTQEDWSRVDAALAAALELGAGEREAFLASELAGRDDLIREARTLLSYNSRPGDPVMLGGPGDWAGRHAGPYRIVARSGEGGMGVVWKARRDDGQFQRDVAIKFLRAFAPDTFTLDRFLKERDILARLDHPNIARLLDAGFTGDGARQPFLVLDWIDGKPIDVFVQESRMGIRQILQLFRQACAAVDYAHRQLVVHRDIKPSNVFVTSDGEVKLLDFGVAKLLDAGASDQTATMMRALTPDYSSPEQLRGEPVSTGDDVFSLGVLLYELLAGERPFHLSNKTLGEIVTEAGRRVPAKPSSVQPAIAPDLDAIVLKAMRPEATERYASAAELMADVDRFLGARPVTARPASAWYIACKFVRRHRLSVAAAGIAVALVAASAVVALRQRARAEQRFNAVRQLARSVMFDYQRDISRLPGTLAVRQKMVRNSLAYLDSLGSDAQDDPRLLPDIANGYHQLAIAQGKPSVANLGDFPGALASARKARAAFDRLLTIRPGDYDTACNKGDLIFDIALIQQRVAGEDPNATRREGIQYWEDLARRHPDRERALRGLAVALFYKPDYERSLQLYEQLAVRFPGGKDYDHDIALLCRMLAGKIFSEPGDLDRGRRLVERAVAIDEKRLAAAPLDRGASLDLSFDLLELAGWYRANHDRRGEVALVERAEALRADLVRLAPDDEQAKDRLLFVWYLLGDLNAESHQYQQSNQYYARVLKLGETMSRQGQARQPFEEWVSKAKEGLARNARQPGQSEIAER